MAEVFVVATCDKVETPKEIPWLGKNRTVTAYIDCLIVELVPYTGFEHGTLTLRFTPDTPAELKELKEFYAVGSKISFEPTKVA
jgi:hypothetical protein